MTDEGTPGLARRTLGNSAWGMAGFILPLFISIFLSPFMVHRLGADLSRRSQGHRLPIGQLKNLRGDASRFGVLFQRLFHLAPEPDRQTYRQSACSHRAHFLGFLGCVETYLLAGD